MSQRAFFSDKQGKITVTFQRAKAPKRMGKSSLIRTLAHASERQYQVVCLDFQSFNNGTLPQIQDLSLRYGLAWAEGEAGTQQLMPLN